MADKGKVVKSEDDFEDISLDLDPVADGKKEVTDTEPLETASADDDLDIGSLELEDEPAPVAKDTVVPEVVKPKEEIDIDIDLDLGTTEAPPKVEKTAPVEKTEVTAPATETVKKRGRPKGSTNKDKEVKTVAEPPVTTDEPTKTSEILIDPQFEIEKIDTSKYQTRETERTAEKVKELASFIKAQGQIEPVHVHQEGEKYFLMAGFGRVAALLSLGSKTVKALIYKNLSDAEITKISSGTNSGRAELTEWDKIVSVGVFNKKHPAVAKDKEDGESLVSIFGFAKSSIYSYVELYKFFADKKEFVDFFRTKTVPLFVIMSVNKAIKEETTVKSEDIIGFMDGAVTSGKLEKKRFEMELTNFIVEKKMDATKKGEVEKAKEAGLEGDLDVGDIEPKPDKKTAKIIKKDKDGNPIETAPEDDASAKVRQSIVDLLDSAMESLKEADQELTDLLAIDNFKGYTSSKAITALHKCLQKVTEKVAKLI